MKSKSLSFALLICISLIFLSACVSTSTPRKITITDTMMEPILDEQFPYVENKIENDWTGRKKPSVIIYFCYDERYGEQAVTVISNWIQGELESKFVNSGNYKIIDKSNLDRILKEQKFQQSGLIDDSVMVDMGRELGGNYLVVPVVTALNTFKLTVTNIETAELIYSYNKPIKK